MFKFVHVADLHLSKNNRLSDFESSLNQISSSAIENKCDFVLIAGDVFHKRTPDNSAREVFYRFVKSVEPIPIFALVGTHDSDTQVHSLTPLKALSLPNFHVYDSLDVHTVDFNGGDRRVLNILALPHLLRNPSLDEIKGKLSLLFTAMGNYKVVLGHFSVIGAQDGSYVVDKESRDFLIPKDLFDDSLIDYVAAGHIHNHQEIGKVFYSGSIEHVDFGEKDNECGFYFVDGARAHFIPLKTKPMVDLVIDSNTTMDYSGILEDSIVRLKLNGSSIITPISEIKKELEKKHCVLHSVVFVKDNVVHSLESSKDLHTWTDFLNEEIDAQSEKKGLDKALLKELVSDIYKNAV